MANFDRFNLPNFCVHDMLEFFCGDQLGAGISRHTYEYRPNKKWVIKFEVDQSFQNVLEWDTWNSVKGTSFEKYFAPVRQISGGGSVLIMDRTKSPRDLNYPSRLPLFFTDVQFVNFGRLHGKVVCHDYGYTNLLARGLTHAKKKAEWE